MYSIYRTDETGSLEKGDIMSVEMKQSLKDLQEKLEELKGYL